MKNNSSHHSCSLEAECVWQKKPQRQGNDSFTSGMVQPSTTDAEKRTLVRLRMRLRAAHNFAGGCIRSFFVLFLFDLHKKQHMALAAQIADVASLSPGRGFRHLQRPTSGVPQRAVQVMIVMGRKSHWHKVPTDSELQSFSEAKSWGRQYWEIRW